MASRVRTALTGLVLLAVPLVTAAPARALVADDLAPTLSAPSLVERGTAAALSGTALPGTTVSVLAMRTGQTAFAPVATAVADASGAWSASPVAPADSVLYARAGSLRSGLVRSSVVWAEASAPSRALRGQTVAVTLGSRPGTTVELRVRRSGTRDFVVAARRVVGATGQVRVPLLMTASTAYFSRASGVRSATRAVQVSGMNPITLASPVTAPLRAAPSYVVPAPARTWLSGAFSGHTPEENAAFGAWRGRPLQLVNAYLPSDTWEQMRHPEWHLWQYGVLNPEVRMLASTALWPATGGSLAEAATGAYDHHFVELARNLVASGQEDAVLRLGWEFNAEFYRWSVRTPEDAAHYAAAFRSTVDAMRSVPGQRFTFDWNVLGGEGGQDPVLAYPGDAWVDYIGLDLYDYAVTPGATFEQQWHDLVTMQWGLQWQADLAAARGKQISFAEWGVVQDYLHWGSGMGDDWAFVHGFLTWVATHDTAFECYFDWDTDYGVLYGLGTGSGQFPSATSAYLTHFGG